MLFVFFFLKVNAEKVHSRLEIKIYEEFTMLNMIFFVANEGQKFKKDLILESFYTIK